MEREQAIKLLRRYADLLNVYDWRETKDAMHEVGGDYSFDRLLVKFGEDLEEILAALENVEHIADCKQCANRSDADFIGCKRKIKGECKAFDAK